MSERDALIEIQLEAVDEALRTGTPDAPGDEERELQELALALVADSPEPDPGFAADLGERVRTGFPRPQRLAWLPRPGLPQLAGLGVAASILAAVVVAAALIPADDDAVQDASGGGQAEVATPQSGAAEGGRGIERSIAPGEPPVPGDGFAPGHRDRAIARSASLTLAAPADRLDAVASQIATITDRFDGFVLRSSLGTGDDEATGGSFELRIPEARLQPALRDLSRLGDVRSRSQSGEDVTSQIVTAADRLQAARAQRRGLLRRLEAADSDTEVEALRAQLDANAREISGLRSSLRAQRARANYATVSVTLEAGDDAGSSGADENGLGGALEDSLGTLSGSLELAVRALGVAIPLGLLVALGLLVVRVTRQRRREAALT